MSPSPVLGPVRSAHLGRSVRRYRSLSLLLLSLAGPVRAADPAEGPPAPPPPPVIETPEIAISATRTERNVLDIPGNVTVIDAAAIERSGARTVPDLLRREAGLMVTNTTGTPEGFTVEARGFNNGGGNGCSTLVLVDGRRINEPDTGCPDWSFVALEEIERIEIVRGPASVEWGDNAAAGVIQIFTFLPREDGVRTATQLGTGSYGGQEGGGRVSGRAGGAFATAFFAHSDTNGYRDQSGFDADTARLGIGADLGDAGLLRLDGGYGSNHRDRPGTLTRAERAQDRRQADPDSFGDFDRARGRFVQAALDLRPVEDVRFRLTPYLRRRTDDGALSGDDGTPEGFTFTTDTETEQQGLDGQIEWGFDALGQRHTFLFGGEARREDSDIVNGFMSSAFGNSDTDVRLRRETWGVFAQQEVGLREDLHLLLGVRRDEIHYSGSGSIVSDFGTTRVDVDTEPSVWSPRASLDWRVTEAVGLYGGYSRGFRSANVQEEVSLAAVAPVDPQKTESWEIGGKLRNERGSANLAFYWMNVRDEILFDPTTFSNSNIDRVRHRGIEAAGTLHVREWLDVYASYTFDDVQIIDGVPHGGQLPITPRNRGALGAIVFLPWGFELGGDALWIGSRPLANDLDNSSRNLPSYGVYDARFAWRHERGPFELVLEAVGKNLGDRKYSEFGGEPTFGTEPGFFPSPERNYGLAVRLAYRR